jgi:hypothetical protein
MIHKLPLIMEIYEEGLMYLDEETAIITAWVGVGKVFHWADLHQEWIVPNEKEINISLSNRNKFLLVKEKTSVSSFHY